MNEIKEQTSILDRIPEELGVESQWVERGNVSWLAIDKNKLRPLARTMNACHARFVTITATELPGTDGFRLEYLWDLEGKLLGFLMEVTDKSIESIYDICPATDWIEREIHEGFALEIEGRACEPLLLRPGDKLGMNMREGAK